MLFFSPSQPHKKQIAGFTLVELMVSITIMVMVLGVVMFNYRSFDSGIILTSLAYDIGLSVREAQSYGISVKGQNNAGVTDQVFTYPYGVHFDITTPSQYVVFVDRSVGSTGVYDVAANPTEKIKTYTIKTGFSVIDLCTLPNSGGAEVCSTTVKGLDITFTRPNPDATINWKDSLGVWHLTTTDSAKIKISGNKYPAILKTIIIRSTGQISIQ